MKKAGLVLMGLAAVLVVLLPGSTVSAASVYVKAESISSEGCSVGDNQMFHANIEWSGGTTGYGKFETWYSVKGDGLLYYDLQENTSLPPAFSQLAGSQFNLSSDLAPGTIIQVDFALTVDSDVAAKTVYYKCGDSHFWSPTAGTTTPDADASAPGPDMVPIPPQAVVGTFTTATPLHYTPALDGASSYVMEAGQSLWVLGVDETGTFYQVLLSGNTYWVPVANIGPTYDEVWGGAPLPTEVIE